MANAVDSIGIALRKCIIVFGLCNIMFGNWEFCSVSFENHDFRRTKQTYFKIEMMHGSISAPNKLEGLK
jgi:hypothetical protein